MHPRLRPCSRCRRRRSPSGFTGQLACFDQLTVGLAVELLWRHGLRCSDDKAGLSQALLVDFGLTRRDDSSSLAGVSMALTLRQEYSAVIERSGGKVDGLIEELRRAAA